MSLDRDHNHSSTTATPSRANDDLAPGRSNAANQLEAPTKPLVSALIQRKARDANGVAAGAESAVATAAGSSGSSLPTSIQRKFESSLGADLSSVRVHTGSDSQSAADAVGAKAYTVGNDIHFGSGHYDPGSSAGEHLLAHEVAHTVQQSGGIGRKTQFKLEVSTPNDHLEVEADRAADAMVSGATAEVSGGGGIARKIMRDGDPNATANAGTNTSPAKTEQVKLEWYVDWENKETGAAVAAKTNARTGNDSASGTLKAIPDKDADSQTATFNWVNAAKSGAVTAGSMAHGKGKGGTVSTSIAWGGHPSASASVKVIETSEKKQGQSKVQAMQKAASAAASKTLEAELETQGNQAVLEADMLKAAKAAVKDGDGYTYDVSVAVSTKLDGKDGNSRGLGGKNSVAYSGPASDGDRRTASITVPTQVQKLMGNGSVETYDMNEHEDSKNQSSGKQEEHSKVSTVDTKTFSQITSDVTTYLETGFKDAVTKITKSGGEVSGKFSGSLNAGASGGASIKDLELDLGMLIGLLAIELGPEVSLLIKEAVGKGKVGANFDGNVKIGLSADAGAKYNWSDEEVREKIRSKTSQVHKHFTTNVTNELKTRVVIKDEVKTQEAQGSGEANKDGHSKKVSSSSETVSIKYLIGEPVLNVK